MREPTYRRAARHRRALMARQVLRENFRSRPEGVQTYVERKRTDIEKEYKQNGRKTKFFNLKNKSNYEDAKKRNYAEHNSSFPFRFHQKMPDIKG